MLHAKQIILNLDCSKDKGHVEGKCLKIVNRGNVLKGKASDMNQSTFCDRTKSWKQILEILKDPQRKMPRVLSPSRDGIIKPMSAPQDYNSESAACYSNGWNAVKCSPLAARPLFNTRKRAYGSY